MPTMFQPLDTGIISYCKMYSTFKDQTTKNCFAFILMPISQQRKRVALQSIQFDFNMYGDVLALSFFYTGPELQIQKKAEQTMLGIVGLKERFGRGEELNVFNNNTLKLGLVARNNSQAYLSDIMDFIRDIYYMDPDFSEDIKSQIINQKYLAHEFNRLFGKVPEKDTVACSIM